MVELCSDYAFGRLASLEHICNQAKYDFVQPLTAVSIAQPIAKQDVCHDRGSLGLA